MSCGTCVVLNNIYEMVGTLLDSAGLEMRLCSAEKQTRESYSQFFWFTDGHNR